MLVVIGVVVILYVQRTLVAPIRDLAVAARRIEAAFRERFPGRVRGRGAMLGLETHGVPGSGKRLTSEFLAGLNATHKNTGIQNIKAHRE